MYKCSLSKFIWTDTKKSDIHECLTKEVSIPFPPFKGLDIRDGKFHSGEIISVTWDSDKQVFGCNVEDEFPWEDSDFHLHTPEEITKFFVKRMGWEIPDLG